MAHQILTVMALLGSQIADAPASPPPTTAANLRVVLKRDTPIELMATREVNTADVQPGTIFKLRVNRPVAVDGKTVIPVGAWVYGEVTSARGSRALGRAGVLQAKLNYLELGEARITVSGDVSSKGVPATSTAVLVALAGVTGFFNRGNEAKIKAGEIITALVTDDVILDISGPVVKRAE